MTRNSFKSKTNSEVCFVNNSLSTSDIAFKLFQDFNQPELFAYLELINNRSSFFFKKFFIIVENHSSLMNPSINWMLKITEMEWKQANFFQLLNRQKAAQHCNRWSTFEIQLNALISWFNILKSFQVLISCNLEYSIINESLTISIWNSQLENKKVQKSRPLIHLIIDSFTFRFIYKKTHPSFHN